MSRHTTLGYVWSKVFMANGPDDGNTDSPETSMSFSQLTQLLAWEDFNNISCCESIRSFITLSNVTKYEFKSCTCKMKPY